MTQAIDIDNKVSMTANEGQITMRSDLRFTACITHPIYQRKIVTMWGGQSRGIFLKCTRLTTVTSSIFI